MTQSNGLTPSPNYDNHFSISNIPFGVVSTPDDPKPQIATRLHGDVFLIPKLLEQGLLGEVDEVVHAALFEPNLTHFASLGRPTHRLIRQKLQNLLREHSKSTTSTTPLNSCSIPSSLTKMHLPLPTPDFSDFSCSKDHVLNAGEAVMGIRRLPPGFPYFPVGYGGRCSSIVVSGTEILRPRGQFRVGDEVVFEESRQLDFEVEVGVVVGRGSMLGSCVGVGESEEYVFGFVLVNDWSARDIQSLEMSPLGPFQGKSFATTISPWIITIDALSPFRCPLPPRDPSIVIAPYLRDPEPGTANANANPHFAIQLRASITTSPSSTSSSPTAPTETQIYTSNFKTLYWTPRDLIAQQTVNGCPLSPGDILATGTISGSEPGSQGCLLEITAGGKREVRLGSGEGEGRMYLGDGDGVRIVGWGGKGSEEEGREGEGMVGFGECFGAVRGRDGR